MDSAPTTVSRLRELPYVRSQSQAVYDLVKQGHGKHFELHEATLDQVADYVAKLIQRDFADLSKIPPHGRWQHIDAGVPHGRIEDQLLFHWNIDKVDAREQCRRLIDLFLVSVLLDAGAGNDWSYLEKSTGKTFARSEGIAVATFHMFLHGSFSSDPSTNHAQVDGPRLKHLSALELARGLQVTPANPIADLDGRVKLLNKLGQVLSDDRCFQPDQRPGNILDAMGIYQGATVSTSTFWRTLIVAFEDIWDRDKRIIFEAKNLGDIWPSDTLSPNPADPLAHFVPFHKLSQWLAYSLMTPLRRVLGVSFTDSHLLTGLPEYRNGGLFVDLGVLALRPADVARGLAASSASPASAASADPRVPTFQYNDPVVVEWRACTVVLLDALLGRVTAALGAPLTLAQMLEAGSWKGGREIAAARRPGSRGPPIAVVGDGTLF